MGRPICSTPVPFTHERVEQMCLPHTLDKLWSEWAAPRKWFRTYLLCGTRPDITFVVGQLSRPSFDFRPGYVRAARKVVWYLKGSIDPEERKSVMGYCFCTELALGSCSNKKRRTVLTSTSEAEYIALGHASEEGVWMGETTKTT